MIGGVVVVVAGAVVVVTWRFGVLGELRFDDVEHPASSAMPAVVAARLHSTVRGRLPVDPFTWLRLSSFARLGVLTGIVPVTDAVRS